MIPRISKEDHRLAHTKFRKKVAMFLGFAGYYQTFIPQYSRLINWLNGIKKAEKFLWKKEIERDFIKLRTRLHQVKESIHQGRNASFPRLWGWRSIHINHRLAQREHHGGVVLSAGWEEEVPWILAKEV